MGIHIYEGGCAVMLCLPNPALNDASATGKENKAKLNAIKGPLYGAVDVAIPGFEVHPVGKWHVTLAFVGRDMSSVYAQKVINAAWEAFSGQGRIRVDFRGEFQAWGSGKAINLVMPAQHSEGLTRARADILARLEDQGVRNVVQRFNPHLTLASVPKTAANPSAKPIEPFSFECTEVEVKYGQQRMRIELG